MSKWALQIVRPDGSADRNMLDSEPRIRHGHGGIVVLEVNAMGNRSHIHISPYATSAWILTEVSDSDALDMIEADAGRSGKEARQYAAQVWGVEDSG